MRTTKNLVISSMLAALVCVATMIIKIPSPLKGYINLGDCIVLTAGWLLSPFYGFLAAGIGSALADLLSGYVFYAPATFVIKGLMAIAAYYIFKAVHKKLGIILSKIISGTAAEIIMIGGYFLYEGFLYGFIPSLVNIPPNAVQGIVGLAAGIVISNVFQRNNIIS